MPSHVHPYPHDGPKQMSEHSQHQSTARILVPSRPFGLAEQGLPFEQFFRQGGNAWNLLDFDNQSAAFICVDTIKYDSIPSVPSRLEGVKTRPDLFLFFFASKFKISPQQDSNSRANSINSWKTEIGYVESP